MTTGEIPFQLSDAF